MQEPLLFHQGVDDRTYEYMGCHVTVYRCEDGSLRRSYIFRTWAPHATTVFVTGDFNGWGNSDPMYRITPEGIWEAEIDAERFSRSGLFKYRIFSPDGESLMSDPFATQFESPPATASIAGEFPAFLWHDEGWLRYRFQSTQKACPVNVYRVHLGSWKRRENGTCFTYDEIACDLACYVKQMGYTHVRLSPITEHRLNDLPGDGVCGCFAPTAQYGTPEQFMQFIDIMHEAGVGVILDWELLEFLKNTQFPFSLARNEGKSFFLSCLAFWVRKYHVDGFCLKTDPQIFDADFWQKTVRNCLGDEILISFRDEWPPEEMLGSDWFLDAVPGDYLQKFAKTRALFGDMMTRPVKKQTFMGCEIGQFCRWECGKSTEWFLLDYESHAKLQRFFAELNHFYLANPALWEGAVCLPIHGTTDTVLSFCRRDDHENEFAVVINFTSNTLYGQKIGVSSEGSYVELFNSDSVIYGGSGVKNVSSLRSKEQPFFEYPYTIEITVPPLTICVFQKQKNV